jgi:hypothetical protein
MVLQAGLCGEVKFAVGAIENTERANKCYKKHRYASILNIYESFKLPFCFFASKARALHLQSVSFTIKILFRNGYYATFERPDV